jgi:hypothetical protein
VAGAQHPPAAGCLEERRTALRGESGKSSRFLTGGRFERTLKVRWCLGCRTGGDQKRDSSDKRKNRRSVHRELSWVDWPGCTLAPGT